ncbi:hypothetical protein [Vibrio parahaemolyticus]|uniref:hypothetical protein n=1 Tax=Vibrio parahaemolyticus TaxID=670 RepID=UPI001C567B7E|nr:hypothetical protein [Vibrio parahaemolyticus]
MEMLTDNEEKWWKRGVWGLSFLGVPMILAIYHFIIWIKGTPFFPAINPANIPTMLGIVTTFSITMTGFIAAIGAYLLSVSRNPTFSEWRNNGYLSVFFNLYGAAIIFLLATFGALFDDAFGRYFNVVVEGNPISCGGKPNACHSYYLHRR